MKVRCGRHRSWEDFLRATTTSDEVCTLSVPVTVMLAEVSMNSGSATITFD
jgi:hypothetical protein